MWFGGQLPRLGANYSGVQTGFTLTSLNGHFSHVAALPANSFNLPFLAERIYTPTAQIDANPFFKIDHKPTLIYTIGCHSGLSASDEEFTAPTLRADFTQAVLKTSGGNSFSVYDEKLLAELTLYGLPFIRVALPPHAAPEQGEAQPTRIPDDIRTTLAQPAANGVFTRVITMTNTFAALDASGLVAVTSAVQDSFAATSAPQISGVQQTATGKPVLPLLGYDIALQANPDPLNNGGVDGIPTPRGVRLRSATMLPDQTGFTPRVTNTITDQLGLTAQPNPQVGLLNTWLPALPYTAQRTNYQPTATHVVATDKLLVFPAQFSATTGSNGQLRRFTQMVFEVSYIDPRSAPTSIRAASEPPVFDATQIAIAAPTATRATQAAGGINLRLSAAARASGGEPLQTVSATSTIDGQHWLRQPLTLDPASGRYQATFATANGRFSALLEAIDSAGNVTVATNKGALFALARSYLPLLRR